MDRCALERLVELEERDLELEIDGLSKWYGDTKVFSVNVSVGEPRFSQYLKDCCGNFKTLSTSGFLIRYFALQEETNEKFSI